MFHICHFLSSYVCFLIIINILLKIVPLDTFQIYQSINTLDMDSGDHELEPDTPSTQEQPPPLPPRDKSQTPSPRTRGQTASLWLTGQTPTPRARGQTPSPRVTGLTTSLIDLYLPQRRPMSSDQSSPSPPPLPPRSRRSRVSRSLPTQSRYRRGEKGSRCKSLPGIKSSLRPPTPSPVCICPICVPGNVHTATSERLRFHLS